MPAVTPSRGGNRKAAFGAPIIDLKESSDDQTFHSAEDAPPTRETPTNGRQRLAMMSSNTHSIILPPSLSPPRAEVSPYFQRTTRSFAQARNRMPDQSPIRQCTFAPSPRRDSPLARKAPPVHHTPRDLNPPASHNPRSAGRVRNVRSTRNSNPDGERIVTTRESFQNMRNSDISEVEPIEFVAPPSGSFRKSQSPTKRSFISSSRETSFESIYGGRSVAAPTTAPSSFQECDRPGMHVDFEDEIPTDIDEDIELPDAYPTQNVRLSRKQLIAREIDLENEQVQLELEVLEIERLEALAKRRNSYDPDSEEERLIEYPDLPDIDPWELHHQEEEEEYDMVSDDEYDIESSLAQEMSMMDISTPGLEAPERSFDQFPLFVQHEVTRIGLELRLSLHECNDKVARFAAHYGTDFLANNLTFDAYLTAFGKFAKALADRYPDQTQLAGIAPMTDIVWAEFVKNKHSWPDSLQFSGTLKMISSGNSDMDFELRLNPLSTTQGHRLGYRFGHDRFMVLKLPYPKEGSEDVPRALRKESSAKLRWMISNWLEKCNLDVMNRKWRCFYVRDGQSEKRVNGIKVRNNFLRAFFFAESGAGLGKNVTLIKKTYLRCVDRQLRHREQERGEKTVRELIEWVFPLDKIMEKMRREDDPAKRGGMFSKAWSRIALSKTAIFSRVIKLMRFRSFDRPSDRHVFLVSN